MCVHGKVNNNFKMILFKYILDLCFIRNITNYKFLSIIKDNIRNAIYEVTTNKTTGTSTDLL